MGYTNGTRWLGCWDNQMEMMNTKEYKENGKAVGMMKGRDRKVWQFSRNEF